METDLRSGSITAETPVWTARKSIWNENLAARRLGARRAPHSKTGLFQRVISPLGGVYRIRGVDVNNSMRQLPRMTILSQLFSLDFPPILIILELGWPLCHIDLAVRYRLPG